jgi:hypothetical protein
VRSTSVLLALAAAASADDIVLKNGATLSGIIRRETPEAVTLDIPQGTIRIERHQIRSIERSEDTPLHEFRARAADTADHHWDLADWCVGNGLSCELRPLIVQALKLDPQLKGASARVLAAAEEMGLRSRPPPPAPPPVEPEPKKQIFTPPPACPPDPPPWRNHFLPVPLPCGGFALVFPPPTTGSYR